MGWGRTVRPEGRGDAASINGGKPLARSADLIIEELDGEVLIYDQRVHRAHCLSAAAAQVWRRCDGCTPADALGATLELDADTVHRALDELVSCGLLETATPPRAGTTRRELAIRVAKAGVVAAAAPLIVSVAAPLPVQAATLAFCRSASTTQGCGACCQLEGCCCCEPANGVTKDCVPADCGDATCISLQGEGAHCSCGGIQPGQCD